MDKPIMSSLGDHFCFVAIQGNKFCLKTKQENNYLTQEVHNVPDIDLMPLDDHDIVATFSCNGLLALLLTPNGQGFFDMFRSGPITMKF